MTQAGIKILAKYHGDLTKFGKVGSTLPWPEPALSPKPRSPLCSV